MRQPPDAVLLIGHGSRDAEAIAEYVQLAGALSERLGVAVQPCFLEFAAPSVVDGLRACVEDGARRIVALPLFLGPAGHQKNDVPVALNWARATWPEVEFQYGTPLGAQFPIVAALAERAAQALAANTVDISVEETALIVVGRGSSDPDSNSEVAKIARLLLEGRAYGWVEPAFFSLTRPDLATTIDRCVRLGARRVVVLPYLLFTGRIGKRIGQSVDAARLRHLQVAIITARHLGQHQGVITAIVQRYQEALAGTAAMTCDLCKYRQRFDGFEEAYGLPQRSDHQHGMRGVAHNHGVTRTIEILPPRYQGRAAVSAAPMVATELIFDAEGRVAWDQIWGRDDPESPFCELALAGGPPHRGALLEPAAPDSVVADPASYARVLAELARGIDMTTGLRVMPSAAPGWIGVRCASEEMAIWLLRAVVIENISVRREGTALFLPAGPAFQLEHEIRSVITVLAKTHHYWQEHVLMT